jgi:uncharacterized protein YggE
MRNLIIAALVTLTLALPASAESTGAIHASGQHEIKLAPQKLRLSLHIRAEGADAKSAVEAFVKHKDRIKKDLLEMKAEEASIVIDAPTLAQTVPGIPAEYSAYAARYLPPPVPGEAARPNVPKVFVATSQVKAEWPLPTTDADALALIPETLKEQIKTRDLAGEKNKAKLDSSQQEKLEELQAAMRENYAASTEDSHDFTVAFVAKVDEESRKAAIKAAYDRAFAQAETLAAVTSHKLGNLVSLRCEETPSTEADAAMPNYAAAMSAAYLGLNANNIANHTDALSNSPAGLKLNVQVHVEFAIAK